jgi:hypothetical protein
MLTQGHYRVIKKNNLYKIFYTEYNKQQWIYDMPSYYKVGEWIFLGFRKSKTRFKKYDAILKHVRTGKIKYLPFGDARYEQYQDLTGLDKYPHLNHGDSERRRRYRKRHRVYLRSGYYSPSYFSWHYLW